MGQDDQDRKMSKSERKQARREMADAAMRAPAKGGGFSGLGAAEKVAERNAESAQWRATHGAVPDDPSLGEGPLWLRRERLRAKEEHATSVKVWPGLVLCLAGLGAFAAFTPGPNQALATQIVGGLVLVAVVLGVWLWRRPVSSPFLEVVEHRRGEVVWVYGVETTFKGAGGGKAWSATLCLSDGTRVVSNGLASDEIPEVYAHFPSAAKGWSEARNQAYLANPNGVT